MFWVIMSIMLIVCLYIQCIIVKKLTYWQTKNVPQDKVSSILWNMFITIFGFNSFGETWKDYYNKHKTYRYYGDYQLFSPILFIQDPDLIKNIFIKDFTSFTDRRSFVTEKSDPIFANSLFALKGTKWRCMRATLSPAYSTFKMRQMFELINKAAFNYVDYYQLQLKQSKFQDNNQPIIEIDCKDSFMRLGNDVIATCALGIECDSMQNPDNDIFDMAIKSRPLGFIRTMKFLIATNVPRLSQWINADFFTLKVRNFFVKLITTTIQTRERNNIQRFDMIQTLMEAKTKNLRKLLPNLENNDKLFYEMITSQLIIFFMSGCDTISTALSFCCYELAMNKEIQQILYEEIEDFHKKNKNQVTYDMIKHLKYLDMVVAESLRKWPPALVVGRCCTKPYKIKQNNEKTNEILELQINPGDKVLVSVFSVHRDEKIYPNPETFDPERFNEQNKQLRSAYTYLPFGLGPRNCIAERFALMEIKCILIHLLLHFEVIPRENTQIPMKIGKGHLNLLPERKIVLGLKRRVTINHDV